MSFPLLRILGFVLAFLASTTVNAAMFGSGGAKRPKDATPFKTLEKAVKEFVEAAPDEKSKAFEGFDDMIYDKKEIEKIVQKFFEAVHKKTPLQDWKPVKTTPEYPSVPVVETSVGKVKVMMMGKGDPKQPVVIYLHGGGKKEGNDLSWLHHSQDRCSIVNAASFRLMPRCVDDEAINGWIIESGQKVVEELVDVILRDQLGDPDRIYLFGASMGGFGTYRIAEVMGDRFAAHVAIASGLELNGTYENFRNLNFLSLIGDQDTAADRLKNARLFNDRIKELKRIEPNAYPCDLKEYPGVGHGFPDTVLTDCNNYIKGKTRNPYPKIVNWNPSFAGLWRNHFYNLKIDQPKHQMKARFEVSDDNVVSLTTENINAITLYFNDSLIKYDAPVVVNWNGKEAFRGELKQQLSVTLETLSRHYDDKMFYTSKIELKLDALSDDKTGKDGSGGAKDDGKNPLKDNAPAEPSISGAPKE